MFDRPLSGGYTYCVIVYHCNCCGKELKRDEEDRRYCVGACQSASKEFEEYINKELAKRLEELESERGKFLATRVPARAQTQ